MATGQKAINTYPEGTPTATSRFPFFDAGGSINYAKLADLQEVLPPPILYQNIALDQVKIAYKPGITGIYLSPLTDVANRQSNFYGLYIPQYGRIIYPEVISLPWGDNTTKYSNIDPGNYFTTLTSGKALTQRAYTESASNRGSDCAIGYAQNFGRFINGVGIGRGNWYIPSPSEFSTIISPLINILRYAASLFGFTWPSTFWTSNDAITTAHVYFNGDIQASSKTNANGVLLMAERPLNLDIQS